MKPIYVVSTDEDGELYRVERIFLDRRQALAFRDQLREFQRSQHTHTATTKYRVERWEITDEWPQQMTVFAVEWRSWRPEPPRTVEMSVLATASEYRRPKILIRDQPGGRFIRVTASDCQLAEATIAELRQAGAASGGAERGGQQ